MFIGHLGAGLALKKINPRVNLGWIFLAVMFPDILLWILVLTGKEQVFVPANYDNLHYLTFNFPYSHGLVASLGWAVFFFFLIQVISGKTKVAWMIFIAIFSHFILDFIVHIPELPVLGEDSQKLGLGLWNNMPVALIIEILLLLGGFMIYASITRTVSLIGKLGMPLFLVLITLLAVFGQMMSPAPTNMKQVAFASLATIIIISLLGGWLDTKRPTENL
jgi:hypothetical protein